MTCTYTSFVGGQRTPEDIHVTHSCGSSVRWCVYPLRIDARCVWNCRVLVLPTVDRALRE